MESFKEVDMVVVGHPGLHTILESGQNYCFVGIHFGILDIAFSAMLVKSAEYAVCLSKSVVHLFINIGVGGYHATLIGELLNCFQLCPTRQF